MRIFLLFFALACVFFACGCGLWNKYFLELDGAYFYDRQSFILKKSRSEVTWNENEILLYSPETKKTTPIEYELMELTLPKRDYATGEMSDYRIIMAYALHEGNVIFTEVPYFYAPHKYFILGGSQDSAIVTIDDENAFLVNLTEMSAKKLFDDSGFGSYFDKNAENKLIYAKLLSASPDGKYLLYLSNRDYIKENTPKSIGLYRYDMQTGAEGKIMDFGDMEFLGWEEGSPGNFLFRESTFLPTEGKRIYSDIRRYSIPQSAEDIFFSFGEKHINYEMTGNRHAYAVETAETNEKKETLICIYDIYSGETLSVSAGKYSLIWHVELSESKKYAAFFGSYLNAEAMAIAEIITVNTETNKMVPEYEQSQGDYYIDSFEWLPGDVLALNFINAARPYFDLCRLYDITH